MAGRGRPTKFTRENVEAILTGIRLGLAYKHACMFAGVHYSTFNDWKNGDFPNMPRGLSDAEKAEFRQLKDDFNDMLMKAEGRGVYRNFQIINQAAANGDWRASQFLLQARWPEEYGTKNRTELTGPGGGPVQVEQLLERAAAEAGLNLADLQAEADRILEGGE